MFGMLSLLAELQRELIVANTRDGLAASRPAAERGMPTEIVRRSDRARVAAL